MKLSEMTREERELWMDHTNRNIDTGCSPDEEVAMLLEYARDLEHERDALKANQKTPGESMYMGLAKGFINRIMSADADCDPPEDIDLRLACIIHERDTLKKRIEDAPRVLDAIFIDKTQQRRMIKPFESHNYRLVKWGGDNETTD